MVAIAIMMTTRVMIELRLMIMSEVLKPIDSKWTSMGEAILMENASAEIFSVSKKRKVSILLRAKRNDSV